MDHASSGFTLDITNCTCFIGKQYNNYKIQVLTQCQSKNSTKYNQLIKVIYSFNSQVMTQFKGLDQFRNNQ